MSIFSSTAVRNFKSVPDLTTNIKNGMAYQVDRSVSIPYNDAYFDEYKRRGETKIGKELNRRRFETVTRVCPQNKILDIGVGALNFIDMIKDRAYGYDIMDKSVKLLKEKELYIDPYKEWPNDISGVTFWDSLEHLPDPNKLLSKLNIYNFVFVSIPIIEDIMKVKTWKHYKPNEHYWYFTRKGFINWMRNFGFILEGAVLDFEIKAGRTDIYTFIFRKI